MIPKVLVVDDSLDIQSLLAARLRPENVQLLMAGDYETGLRLARLERPDLILLDVELNEASGLDLCRLLKSEEATASIPIIFLTASGDVETKVRGFDLGALDYVTKPFHPAELRARVRAALRLKRSQDMLAERALVDALTGLRNRAFFDQRLDAEILRVRERGQSVALVLLDIDNFKSLNDNYGHPFGDFVLQRIADEAARVIRAEDAACRYGGEELGLVLSDASMKGGIAVAERLRERIQRISFSPRSEVIHVTASFGVACATEVVARTGRVERRQLVDCADQALYQAKRGGRNRVHAWRYEPSISPPSSTRCMMPVLSGFA